MASYLKTSGKTGLHIMVPWAPCRRLRRRAGLGDGDGTAGGGSPACRSDRGAAEGQTTAESVCGRPPKCARSPCRPTLRLRAVPQATVSTPLTWAELTATLEPRRYTPKTTPGGWPGKRPIPRQPCWPANALRSPPLPGSIGPRRLLAQRGFPQPWWYLATRHAPPAKPCWFVQEALQEGAAVKPGLHGHPRCHLRQDDGAVD